MLQEVFDAVSVFADGTQYSPDKVKVRYPAPFFGLHRCVRDLDPDGGGVQTGIRRRLHRLPRLSAQRRSKSQSRRRPCVQRGCVIRFVRVEFHRSATKHGVEIDDVQHAVANAFVVADMGDDESPLRTLVLGPGRTTTCWK